MNIPDGYGFSPDSGEFQIRENKAYWEDGDITDFATQWAIRWMPISKTREAYADWSDEHRVQVCSEWVARRQQWQAEQDQAREAEAFKALIAHEEI